MPMVGQPEVLKYTELRHSSSQPSYQDKLCDQQEDNSGAGLLTDWIPAG